MVYCGARCRAQAEALFHARLCGTKAAFEAFLSPYDDHTRMVAEMMLRIVAMMLQEAQRNGGDATTACEPFLRWTSERNAAEPLQLPLARLHDLIRRELRLSAEEEGWLTEAMLDRISAMVCLNSIQIRMRSPFADYFGTVKRRVHSEEEKRIAQKDHVWWEATLGPFYSGFFDEDMVKAAHPSRPSNTSTHPSPEVARRQKT